MSGAIPKSCVVLGMIPTTDLVHDVIRQELFAFLAPHCEADPHLRLDRIRRKKTLQNDKKKSRPAKPPASAAEDAAYLVSPPLTSEPRLENMNITDATGCFLESHEWSTILPEQQMSNPSQGKCTSRQNSWNGHTFDSHGLIPELLTGFHDYDTEMEFSDFQILTPDSAITGRHPSAVIGDSPSFTSYNQSTVSSHQNDADQAQYTTQFSLEPPTIITKDNLQNALQDMADDTEACIRGLSELSLTLSQCRRLFSQSNASASTQKNSRPNGSQNVKNRLPAILIDSIFRCSQRIIDLIQHAKKNIVKQSVELVRPFESSRSYSIESKTSQRRHLYVKESIWFPCCSWY